MSIEEFRRRQGAAIPSAKPAPSRVVIPKVSESFSVPSNHGVPAVAGGPADPGFASGLLRDLREAFVGAGVNAAGLSAEVGFLLAADGSLEAVRIRRSSGNAAFDAAKAEYRKSLNLIWLKPYGAVQGGSSSQLLAPVISNDVLSSLPALPKLLTKLSGITGDSGYSRIMKSKGDEKPKKLAKDLLKSKKLI